MQAHHCKGSGLPFWERNLGLGRVMAIVTAQRLRKCFSWVAIKQWWRNWTHRATISLSWSCADTSVMRCAQCFSTRAILTSLSQTQYFINRHWEWDNLHSHKFIKQSVRGSKSMSRSSVTAIYSYISVMSPFHWWSFIRNDINHPSRHKGRPSGEETIMNYKT